jgi:hypothetical protein
MGQPMNDAARSRLLGTYRTPRFRYDKTVRCEVRGEVTIVRLSDGPIPWPIGKRGRGKSLVVFKNLARAVRRESELAVVHWWGVSVWTVWKWRKALGVGATTEGASRLRRDYSGEPWARRARRKAVAKACDPGRRAKIAAARRGRPRPPEVVEAVRQAHLGAHHTEEKRRRMSETHRRRGTRPPKAGEPWAPWEDELVRALRPTDAARRTGRTLQAVYGRRRVLKLSDGRAGRKVPGRGGP